jgi:octaheme c-type cytochrome (tetrathionate reductase family)
MRRLCFKSIIFYFLALCMLWIGPVELFAAQTADDEQAPGLKMAQQATRERQLWITADHSKHPILQKQFNSGPEVTQACLSCHSEAAVQFQKTIHWTWLDPNVPPQERVGKAGLSINNFCIAVHGSYPRCTSCHAGFGFKDMSFDFSDQTKVDCLVCHEQTGTYKKFPAGAGNPVSEPTVFKGNGKTYQPPDWNKVAQSVGRPTRKNCGTCHFFGGGGDGVKHGDMDSSLMKPNKELDVHMGLDGKKFDCVRCHTTVSHQIAGRTYATPAATDRKSLVEDDLIAQITCESCHTATPHKPGEKPNDHTDKVACQSCHIPEFARVNPTKMWWDWSKAGQKKDGKPFKKKGEFGKPVYFTLKGDMAWGKNVKPEYDWYNGSIAALTANDMIDPSRPIQINWPVGSQDDPNSRISPFKVHRGKQPYDKINKTLLIPHLFGKKGSGAYWADWDWKKALESGAGKSGTKFSGEFDFVETSYIFPITHMVAPRDKSLSCTECHSKTDSRLANLQGFYMPGRDGSRIINYAGWGVVIASLFGVLIHALGRLFSRGNGRWKEE